MHVQEILAKRARTATMGLQALVVILEYPAHPDRMANRAPPVQTVTPAKLADAVIARRRVWHLDINYDTIKAIIVFVKYTIKHQSFKRAKI
jgi:hypothetical protein